MRDQSRRAVPSAELDVLSSGEGVQGVDSDDRNLIRWGRLRSRNDRDDCEDQQDAR